MIGELLERARGGPRPPVPVDGFAAPEFGPLVAAFRDQLVSYPGGGAVCVYRAGRCVVDLWGGYRDADGTPWTRDTMAPSFSTTKGVASTVAHILVDRGLLDYDARVAAYWPAFAQAGKARITVRHVLAHQSGLYHIRRMIDRAERMLDWDYMVRAIERAEPVHEPGTRTGYHGLTYGFLIGEIVRRVTGKPFSQVARETIAEPLGLDGLYVGCPKEQLHRAARLIWPRGGVATVGREILRRWGPEIGDVSQLSAAVASRVLAVAGIRFDLPSILDALAPRGISAFQFDADATLQAAIPAANGLFTARALARMYAALAEGGVLDGVRLLSRPTLLRATRVQVEPVVRAVIPFDMRWRLGYHGVLTTRGVPRRAFGHFGFGGSGAWADPQRRLAVALIVNSGMGTPFGDWRVMRVSGAVLGCVDGLGRRLAARRADVVATSRA